jgi:short-subunit dehydrogenase
MRHILLKPLAEQVIVITGASSGIGLATARAAVREGASVVLVARNADALANIERELRSVGGDVTSIVADVATREDVQRVAATAIERMGGFDTWINNAGVSIWGKLEDVSEADHRRLFDVNFWGVVNGSITALEHLKPQGGAIINLGSALSDAAFPLQGMYSASKHAVKAFTDALRMEVDVDHVPVSVTLIKPSSINTPFPQHARNYTGREPQLASPAYDPEEVALAILYAACHPVRDLHVGATARVLGMMNAHVPSLLDWIGARITLHQQLRDEAPRQPEGALYEPGIDGAIHGEHPGVVFRRSYYTRAKMNPRITGSVVAGAGCALLGWWIGRRLLSDDRATP